MKNSKKMFILGCLLVPSVLTGCGNKDIEVVEEWTVAEDKNEDNSNENQIVSEGKDLNISNSTEIKDKLENKEDLSNKNNDNKKPSSDSAKSDSKEDNFNKEDKIEESNESDKSKVVFKKSPITDSIKSRMDGKSMPSDSTVSYDELSYLTITYLDFNGNTKQGEMVVNAKLADEVLDIFKEIYEAKAPIESMRLIDDYGASDYESMVNNNSSAFCYRTIAGTSKISNHGKGMAIDINPFENPHVLKSKGEVNPPEASKYADRSLNDKGMIKENDAIYKAFTKRGWKWGGHWNNPDYQHFEKVVY